MPKRFFTVSLSAALLLSACGQAIPTDSSSTITFPKQYQISVGDHPSSVFSQDLDLDGDPDLIATNEGEGVGNTISVLINDDGKFHSSIITVGEEPIAVVA